ncbi:sugar phosphate isomerase/epimerase [Bacillus sp. CMF21]|uniref:sugar phosphate isomerase/epimerase family protein n=1 Tax=Metabacillus dongyingensis TaxID=2874282 RepID=UPI001CBBF826|nr:sugar phosphate isomerase/epimerase family protein [Metabacillus dongyingensis]UAL53643.1 sugar phosphate isomerase/epimerase [Metabacillus dongyingensis]USK29954.1 sugar phosphate isomerase/epimerase [Bacillus sp. CMF21]
MLKGINQWCYPDGTSLEKIFEYSYEAGFEAVELNVYEEGGIGLTMETAAQEAAAIVKMAEKYGLKLPSLSTGLLWKAPLSSPDENVREKGRSIVKKQIELAEAMGIGTVLVVPGVVNEETSYAECYERSQIELRKLAAFAEEKKVHIGIENVWNKFLLSPLEMARYIDEIESQYAGAYFDVGNVLQFGYPEQWIRILNDRIRKVHVKDFRTSIGNITGFVSLLAGDVNWAAVMKALKEIKYDDVLTAELSPYLIAPQELANDTARQMDVILSSCTITQKV